MVSSAARPGCGQRHGAPQPRVLDQLLRLGLVRPENPSRSTGRNGCSCRITLLIVRNGDAGRRVPGARRSTFKLAPAASVVFSDCAGSVHRKPDSESGALRRVATTTWFLSQKSRSGRKEKGSHRCNPLFIWRARQDLNPRPPWFVVLDLNNQPIVF